MTFVGSEGEKDKLGLSLCTHSRRHGSGHLEEAYSSRPSAEDEDALLKNVPPPSGDKSCRNVQVSFATESSVTVTWRPPRGAYGKDLSDIVWSSLKCPSH